MANKAMAGLIVGAVGTTALNVVTYADMVLRGRPASETPAKVAGILAGKVGVDLSGGEGGQSGKEQAQSRQEGLGSLLSYVTGAGQDAPTVAGRHARYRGDGGERPAACRARRQRSAGVGGERLDLRPDPAPRLRYCYRRCLSSPR